MVKPRPYKSNIPKECLHVGGDDIEVKEINF